MTGSLIEKCARDLNKHFRRYRKCKHIKVVQLCCRSEKTQSYTEIPLFFRLVKITEFISTKCSTDM